MCDSVVSAAEWRCSNILPFRTIFVSSCYYPKYAVNSSIMIIVLVAFGLAELRWAFLVRQCIRPAQTNHGGEFSCAVPLVRMMVVLVPNRGGGQYKCNAVATLEVARCARRLFLSVDSFSLFCCRLQLWLECKIFYRGCWRKG